MCIINLCNPKKETLLIMVESGTNDFKWKKETIISVYIYGANILF